MLARNALLLAVATALTAVAAGGQQPAKPATKNRGTPAAPAPTAAKNAARTSAVSALPITADSAKRIVAANAPGATVSSAQLKRNGGKPYYAVTYRVTGDKHAMHARVDANTGAFVTVAPPTGAKSAKKPS